VTDTRSLLRSRTVFDYLIIVPYKYSYLLTYLLTYSGFPAPLRAQVGRGSDYVRSRSAPFSAAPLICSGRLQSRASIILQSAQLPGYINDVAVCNLLGFCRTTLCTARSADVRTAVSDCPSVCLSRLCCIETSRPKLILRHYYRHTPTSLVFSYPMLRQHSVGTPPPQLRRRM